MLTKHSNIIHILSSQRPQSPLKQHTRSTSTNNNPAPLVTRLLQVRPEAVLLLLVILELRRLDGVLLSVPLRLILFILAVSANKPQEDVVHNRAQRGEGVEETRADKQDRE